MSKSPLVGTGSKLGIGRSGTGSTSAKDDSSENKTTSLDLGYDSLHSTPKTMQSETLADSTKSPPQDSSTNERKSRHRSLTMCSSDDDIPDDDDEDDEDSLEFNTPRDPIRRRISTIATNEQSIIMANCHSKKRARKCRLQTAFWNLLRRPSYVHETDRKPAPFISLSTDDKTALETVQEDDSVSGQNHRSYHRNSNQNSGSLTVHRIPEEREEWGKKMDFLLSIIGFAVDLSNVWRFPYLCYKNGGGVFLIPYTIMLLFGALPLFFMELALGQFAKSGPINVWDKICPPLKGIGYCFVLISWYVSFYYNVIIGWTTNYVIKTLISGERLPWQHCDNYYNTPKCISMDDIRHLCHGEGHRNATNKIICERLSNRTSPTEEFFNLGLLQIDQSSGLSDLGQLRPELVGCLIIVFVTLYFSLFKGVKSSGKVVWVTATAPYFILTILLVRGLFLPGALSGIAYYINPRMEKLLEPNVWVDAAVQVFYSIGVGFGVHLTYASFNKFDNNCYRDCLITTAVNSLTSFYSGFVIFTFLGYMSYTMDKPIQNVASEGYGLVFQVYPEALSTLPFAQFWSLLFFVMLLTLGIDSAMGGLEAVITGLTDEFNLKWIPREVFTAVIIFTSFLGSSINCTQGGAFTMVWFDTYAAGISLLCSALFEAVAVTYFYGSDRFCRDIESMLGHQPCRYFLLSWKYICPIFLTTIIIMSILNSQPISYYGYNFPMWATILGWCFTLSSISAIPTYAMLYYTKKRYFNRDCKFVNAPIESFLRTEPLVDKNSQNSSSIEMVPNSQPTHDSVLIIKTNNNENAVFV